MVLIATAVLFGCLNCCTQEEDLNIRTFEILTEASHDADSTAYPVLERVLVDMADQGYAYSLSTRERAFEYLARTSDARALPLLRRIARIDIDHQPDRITLDRIAVRGALSALVDLRSPDAEELSLLWLRGDAWARTSAMRNLERLESWEATEAIEEVLCTTPEGAEDLTVSLVAARFLTASPLTTVGVCSCIDNLRRSDDRLQQIDALGWKQLARSLDLLAPRFACGEE